jgi:hypothetical protein
LFTSFWICCWCSSRCSSWCCAFLAVACSIANFACLNSAFSRLRSIISA